MCSRHDDFNRCETNISFACHHPHVYSRINENPCGGRSAGFGGISAAPVGPRWFRQLEPVRRGSTASRIGFPSAICAWSSSPTRPHSTVQQFALLPLITRAPRLAVYQGKATASRPLNALHKMQLTPTTARRPPRRPPASAEAPAMTRKLDGKYGECLRLSKAPARHVQRSDKLLTRRGAPVATYNGASCHRTPSATRWQLSAIQVTSPEPGTTKAGTKRRT